MKEKISNVIYRVYSFLFSRKIFFKYFLRNIEISVKNWRILGLDIGKIDIYSVILVS